MIEMGKIIKRELFERDLNTVELAKRLGCTPENLYGKYARNSFYVGDLEKIADAINCDLQISFVPREPADAGGKSDDKNRMR